MTMTMTMITNYWHIGALEAAPTHININTNTNRVVYLYIFQDSVTATAHSPSTLDPIIFVCQNNIDI